MTTAVLETSQISPPPDAAAAQSLPLTFSDMIWLNFHPIRRLIFYEFPCSKPHFSETIIPKLKHSLSLTLTHFSPLAGSIFYPLSSGELPQLRFTPNDSVTLAACESSGDFDEFVANHARDADQFYDLIPQLPPAIEKSDCKLIRVLAIRVTLFPNRGVCVGIANHHSAVDAASIAAFLRRWSSISRSESVSEIGSPILGRSVFNYPLELDANYWNQIKHIPLSSPAFPLPTNRVRATFALSKSELEKLKLSIQSAFSQVSSFVAMSSYFWSCLGKIDDGDGSGDGNRLEYFLASIDIRSRIDPPVPKNYFGNCLSYELAKIRHWELVSDAGAVAAAQAVATAIRDRLGDRNKILQDAESAGSEIVPAIQGPILAVSGSARIDLYGLDFGFGWARKVEVLSIDDGKYAFSICKSLEGGLEIGMSLPKVKMEAFATCFDQVMKNL